MHSFWCSCRKLKINGFAGVGNFYYLCRVIWKVYHEYIYPTKDRYILHKDVLCEDILYKDVLYKDILCKDILRYIRYTSQ